MSMDAARKWQRDAPRVREQLDKIARLGPGGADTPERVQKFMKREVKRTLAARPPAVTPATIGLERVFGPLDYEYVAPSAEVQLESRSVARLVEKEDDGPSVAPFASGFMVTPRLLLTNHHVYDTVDSAEGTFAQFGYELVNGELQDGTLYRVRPDIFFHSNVGLDYALVAVDTESTQGAPRGNEYTRIIPAEGKILVGQNVHMIGYPNGRPKTYVFKHDPLVLVEDTLLRYLTDSDEGGSGSPAYNASWELIALHHRAVPKMENGRILLKNDAGYWKEGMPTDDVDWLANEGIRISVVFKDLCDYHSNQPNELLAELISLARDPLDAATSVATGASPMGPQEIDVSGAVQMTFTGPVTINVVPAGAGVTPAVSVAPQPAEGVGEEASIRFDPDYDHRAGYDADFLRPFHVPHPRTNAQRLSEMVRHGEGELVLAYHHYSLAMNMRRRLQMWSAVNVDYNAAARQWFTLRKDFGGDKWIADPRIPAKYQIMDPQAYAPSKSLDRGHIVRREDSAWGVDRSDQEFSNSDTFHWTNCTPQHAGFNEPLYSPTPAVHYQGLWGSLENKIATVAQKADEKRLIIFAGPVLASGDPTYNWGLGDVQIPMKFWKIVVAREAGKLTAYGFVLDQTKAFKDLGFEKLNFGKFDHYALSIARISAMTGVLFDKRVTDAEVKQ